MVNPFTSRLTRVSCASAIKEKLDKSLGDSPKIIYKEQGIRVQFCNKISKDKMTISNWGSNSRPIGASIYLQQNPTARL